jgi:hypothetical protein
VRPFFPPTQAATDRITQLFDFVWPTAVALWNLRWQVQGFLNEVPDASSDQLHHRFVFGSLIQGTNLRRSCIDTTWENQLSIFADFILTNALAIYEYWADEILDVLHITQFSGKNLQFAARLSQVINHACTQVSDTMTRAFFPTYSRSDKYSGSIMPNLMCCYRYFKEARNSLMHGGGIASARAEQAYLEFQPVSDRRALGMRGNLIHDPLIEGNPVKLHLRGVVGFCDVLIRIMITVDADLCRSHSAEQVLAALIRKSWPAGYMFPANIALRNRRIARVCHRSGLPKPVDVESVYRFLREQRIVAV